MIAASAVEVVRRTLPLVESSIDQVTPIFYRRMFAAHPELERDLFNRGNQAQGDQQRALAGAIAAYASLLVGNEVPALESMLLRIANKHVSLGITEEQYPIVYRYLFEALGQVLGPTATDEVVEAWTQVYWDMADTLTGREERMYRDLQVAPGDVWRDLVVQSRTQQAPDTVAFVVAAADAGRLPTARPGQYISVQVPLPDGAQQIRQYSLTCAPDQAAWGITVKVVAARPHEGLPAGEVSTFLHRNIFEGDRLRCSMPAGDLILHDGPEPLLLVSAGIGCTPIVGMLHYLARTGTRRPVTVLHADQSMSGHSHRREMADLVDQIPGAHLVHWYEDLGARAAYDTVRHGLIDLSTVPIEPTSQAYLCGPPPFMRAVRDGLTHHGIAPASMHYEVFGPDTWALHQPDESPANA